MPRKELDARREYQRHYRQENKDKINAHARRKRAKNLAAARAYDKRRTEADRELFRARNRQSYYKRDQRLKLLAGARQRARTKGVEFNLSMEDVVIPEKCPILGIPLVPGRGSRGAHHPGSPSLDRLNPKLGYVKGNVAVISNRANVIKNDGNAEEHEAVARYIRQQEAQLREDDVFSAPHA